MKTIWTFPNTQRKKQKEAENEYCHNYIDHVAKSSLSWIEFAKVCEWKHFKTRRYRLQPQLYWKVIVLDENGVKEYCKKIGKFLPVQLVLKEYISSREILCNTKLSKIYTCLLSIQVCNTHWKHISFMLELLATSILDFIDFKHYFKQVDFKQLNIDKTKSTDFTQFTISK